MHVLKTMLYFTWRDKCGSCNNKPVQQHIRRSVGLSSLPPAPSPWLLPVLGTKRDH